MRRIARALLLATGFAACSPSLAELEGFPCADDQTCPPRFTCVSGRCMLGVPGSGAADSGVAAEGGSQQGVDAGTLDTGGSQSDTSVPGPKDASAADTATTPPSTADASGAASDGASDAAVTCQTPQVACSNVCVDLTSNAANCGACGRSCANSNGGAGTCSAGECVPETRASGLTSPLAEVATDGASTVYQNQNKLYKCKVPTCSSSTTELYTDASATATMGGPALVANGNVYFAGVVGGTFALAKCATAGCTSPTVHTKLTPTALAGDATSLFAAEGKVIYSGSHTSASLNVLMTAGATIKSMALSKSDLYYFESGVGIRRCPRTGTCGASSLKVVNLTSGEHPFTVANETLYWANNTTGAISSCVLPNCSTVVTIATGQSAARIVADKDSTLWGNQEVVGCFKTTGCTQNDLHHFVVPGATSGSTVVSMVRVGWDVVWTYSLGGVGSLQRVTARP